MRRVNCEHDKAVSHFLRGLLNSIAPKSLTDYWNRIGMHAWQAIVDQTRHSDKFVVIINDEGDWFVHTSAKLANELMEDLFRGSRSLPPVGINIT